MTEILYVVPILLLIGLYAFAKWLGLFPCDVAAGDTDA